MAEKLYYNFETETETSVLRPTDKCCSAAVMAADAETESMKNYHIALEKVDPEAGRFPYCIVWTPIPVLT